MRTRKVIGYRVGERAFPPDAYGLVEQVSLRTGLPIIRIYVEGKIYDS